MGRRKTPFSKASQRFKPSARAPQRLKPFSMARSTMNVRTQAERERIFEKKKRQQYHPHLSDGYKKRDDRTIFIGGGMPAGIRSKADIGNILAKAFGPVNHVHLQPNLKFGFVHFDTIEAAQDAVNTRKINVMGKEIEIREGSRANNHSMPEVGSHANDAEADISDGLGEFSDDENTIGMMASEGLHEDGGPDMCEGEQEPEMEDGVPDMNEDEHAEAMEDDAMIDQDGQQADSAVAEDMESEPHMLDEEDNEDQEDHHDMGDEPPDAEEDRADEERIQAVRVAVIFALESAGGILALQDLDKEVLEYSAELPPDKTLDDVLRAFSDNFEMQERAPGEFEVKLLSSDVKGMSKMGSLLGGSATPSGQTSSERKRPRMRGRRGKKTGPRADRPRADRTDSNTRQSAAKGPNTVVAGPLSDGFKQRDERTIYIGQLPNKVRTKHDVANACQRAFGQVTHVHVQDDLKFGFVHFEFAHSAAAALNAREVDVLGSRVEVRTAGRTPPDHSREDRGNMEGKSPIGKGNSAHDRAASRTFFPSGRTTVTAVGGTARRFPAARNAVEGRAASAHRDYQAHPPRSGDHTAGGYNADGYRAGGYNAVSPKPVGRASGHSAGGYQAGAHNADGYHPGGYPASGSPAGGRPATRLPPASGYSSFSLRGKGTRREASAPALGSRHGAFTRPAELERRQAGVPAVVSPPSRRPATAPVTTPRTSARSSAPPKPSKAPHLARPAAGPAVRPVAPTPKAALTKRSAEMLGPPPGQRQQPKRLRPSR